MKLFPKDDTSSTFTLTDGKRDYIFELIEGDQELFCVTSTGYCLNIESSKIDSELIGQEIELVLFMNTSLVSTNPFKRKLINIS
ncbi:hypothetical protein [Acinetobacter pittii]|uniref:hypothetical protein n=1 Tax=Acinetobacter pittii TaxID=48296 RepID=UPI00301E2A9B